ncbi:MAG: type II secretion system protein [Alphaproteobacteria bacterium]
MKNKKSGFTLIEMSIVLAIISLLITGIIIGQRIINKSSVDSIIGDIKKWSNALEQFEVKYGGLPGDLANISLLPAGATAGNGNGLIDSSTEAVQFWYHLKLAGLLTNNFNGNIISNYTPASYTTSGGIAAASSMKNAGFSVLNGTAALINNSSSIGKLVFNLSYFPASNYTKSILTPEQAQYLDIKLDDGNPLTGNFRAADGSNAASGACVSGGNYNLSTAQASCYAQIILSSYSPVSTASSSICANGAFGSNTYAQLCPAGYKGYISNHCDGNGNLVVAENLCEPIVCGNNISVGDITTIACPTGYVGKVTLTCGATGVFTIDSSNCQISASATCSGAATNIIRNACPVGLTGLQNYNCSTGVQDAGGCSPQTATTNRGFMTMTLNVGEAGFLFKYDTCPTNYTATAPSDVGYETALLNGQYRIVQSACIPNFGSCTVGTAPRPLGCPMSQNGTYIQRCNAAGYWETYVNTCTSVTCGGEPIGAFRIAPNAACPPGTKGILYEVCDYKDNNYNSANWQITNANCATVN